MATETTTTFTYVSLENLQQYDSLLKPYIDSKIKSGVASSIKTVALDGTILKFYNIDAPVGETLPVFEIELPQQDLSGFLAKFSGATVGDVVIVGDDGKVIKDSGIKLTDLANSDEVNEKIAALKKEINDKIGSLDDLGTDTKSTIVGAINETKAAVDEAKEAVAVTIDTTATSEGMLKSYTLKQGKTTIGTIDIPKDMVVKSGKVVTNPTGLAEGTYLALTLANAEEDTVYINVGTLVDIYTAEKNATQIQLSIDSTTREISGVIVAGSVTSTEIANNAIVTAKIADGNITKAKLSTELQEAIDKASTALQEDDIEALRKEVAANTASLAEGGATNNAIKAAQAAADEAQADVDALTIRVEALESVNYESATEEEIKALFPTT